MFWFDGDKYDFWPVYTAIQTHYPIGISKEEVYVQFYSTSPHRRLRNDAYDRKYVYDKENNQSLSNPDWEKFIEALQNLTTQEVCDVTHPQMPCFSAHVEVERIEIGDVIRKKELLVYISLLGPFYTVIGQNKTSLKTATPNDKLIADSKSWSHRTDSFYPAVHHLVISPYEEFEDTFNTLCKTVEEHFTDFRFVPFSICKSTIAGLEVPQTNDKPASVFQALFSDNHPINFKAPTLGDDYFKADDWMIEGYVEKPRGKWYAFPPHWSEERRNEEIRKLNQDE